MMVWEWVAGSHGIIGAEKLFQKEEKNDDTGISLKTLRTGKIGLKSLVVEYG